MSNDKPILVLDIPLAAKFEGVAWCGAAAMSAGGLTAQATPIAWTALGLAQPELATIWLSFISMGWAANYVSETLAVDLAERHGIVMRELRPARWDITRFSFP